jgi:hypothetical protein
MEPVAGLKLNNIFNVQRHLISAKTHRAFRASTCCGVSAIECTIVASTIRQT